MEKIVRMDDNNITLEQIKKDAADRAAAINGTVVLYALDVNEVVEVDQCMFCAGDEMPDVISERWILVSDDFSELILPDIVMALAGCECA